METKSKEQLIKDYLIAGNQLTQMGAYKMWNYTRLAAVVDRMRMNNIPVKTRMVHPPGRGNGYAVYYIPKAL